VKVKQREPQNELDEKSIASTSAIQGMVRWLLCTPKSEKLLARSDTKYCSGCRRDKSLESFHADGLGKQSRCKECSNKRSAKWMKRYRAKRKQKKKGVRSWTGEAS
jgi:hypothetical protein